MDEIAVLVLNYTFEPLHFTNARRAITLLLAGKAEAVEASPRVVRSPSIAFALPAVIRLAIYIRKPFLDRVAFNKKNILRRDGYTCQYCNRRGERAGVRGVGARGRAAGGRRARALCSRGPAPRRPAWRHRVGQDLHDRQPHRQRGPPDAGDLAEQDPGGPALQRVQGVLSLECR